MLILRDYQEEAIKALYDYWEQKKGVNPIISACVGAGKSLLISKIIKDKIAINENVKILILTHLAELLEQNSEELKKIDNSINVSIYSAGLNKKCLKSNVIYAGIQSIFRNIEKLPNIDFILIDECHLVPKKSDTMYMKTIDFLKSKNENLKIAGFSGTPFRLDGGYLHKGKNCLFDGIAYNIDIKTLVDKGFLCKPIGKNSKSKFDLSNVSIKNGEFDNIELAHITNNLETIQRNVLEFVELGKDRKAWLIFCSGVKHAELVKEELKKYNINSKIVTGDTKKDDRAETLNNFKNGKLKCLININTLVAGYNAPICDMVIILRATMSGALFQQCIGRGLRLYPEKKDALILDYGRNFERFGTIDNFEPIIKKNGNKKENNILAKECKKCNTLNHIRNEKCTECGEEFFREERKINNSEKAYDGSMFSDNELQEWNVKSVGYSKHLSKNGNECLKITHICGLHLVNEFIVLNSYFGKKALREIGCNYENLEDILKNAEEYKKPTKLLLKREGKYMKIEEKLFNKNIVEHCCLGCINMTYYTEKQGYKSIEKYRCDEFKCDLEYEWINEENECDKHDCIPF